MRKNFKKIIAMVLIACTLFCSSTVYNPSENISHARTKYSTTTTVRNRISSTYKKSRSLARRSNFRRQCSLYVYSQLRALKIYQNPDTYWNGSQWYSKIKSNSRTRTGYKQIKYSGKSCLSKIVKNNKGKNVYNIVVSFPRSYRSSSRVGHVLFIHAIIDGKVYYSDNYTYAGKREGSVLVKSVSSFTSYFASNYGGINGAIHFKK